MTGNLQDTLQWIQTNPLLTTLASGGIIFWLISNIRNIFGAIVDGITAVISFSIFNMYEDNRANYSGNNARLTQRQTILNNLITVAPTLWERTVNLDLSENSNLDNTDVQQATLDSLSESNNDKDIFHMSDKNTTCTYGFSIKLLFGKLCVVRRSVESKSMKIIVNTSIRVFFAKKKKFMQKLEKYIKEKHLEMYQKSIISKDVFVLNGQTYAGKKLKRSLNSIFTAGNVHLDLYNDIQKFIENKSTYNKLNYPYNYCALLYGVPGSGKSSTILALASELNRNIVYINLATASTTTLLRQMNDDPDHSIFVFEDIDAITTKSVGNRNSEKKKEDEDCRSDDDIFTRALSLSDMLNITDGLLASDGAISIFTTNHIEKLDPAFLRAGRMNKLIEYTYMNPETAKAMVDAYLDVGDIKLKDNIKPPELQEMILSILVGNKTVQDLKDVFEEK